MNRGGSKNELPASSKNEPSIKTNTNKLLEKKEEKEITDFLSLCNSYYEFVTSQGKTLKKRMTTSDTSFINNAASMKQYENLQEHTGQNKYQIMFEDAQELFGMLLSIEKVAATSEKLRSDTIYGNLPMTYSIGDVLKKRESIRTVFGKAEKIASQATTSGLGFYTQENIPDAEEKASHVDFNGFYAEEKNVATLVKEDPEHDDEEDEIF